MKSLTFATKCGSTQESRKSINAVLLCQTDVMAKFDELDFPCYYGTFIRKGNSNGNFTSISHPLGRKLPRHYKLEKIIVKCMNGRGYLIIGFYGCYFEGPTILWSFLHRLKHGLQHERAYLFDIMRIMV